MPFFSEIHSWWKKHPFFGIIYQWIGAEISLELPHRGNEKQWHNLQTRVISAVYTQLHLCSPRKLLKKHCKFKNSFIFINTSFNCWAEVVFITENSQGFLQTVQSPSLRLDLVMYFHPPGYALFFSSLLKLISSPGFHILWKLSLFSWD